MAETEVARRSQSEQSLAELVRQLAEQTATLSRQELRLAQLELKQKGQAAGIGAGLLGASSVVAIFATAALLSAAGAALSLAVPVWASALVVAGLLLCGAGVLALLGGGRLRRASPPAPEQTAESVREDIHTIKESARR